MTAAHMVKVELYWESRHGHCVSFTHRSLLTTLDADTPFFGMNNVVRKNMGA